MKKIITYLALALLGIMMVQMNILAEGPDFLTPIAIGLIWVFIILFWYEIYKVVKKVVEKGQV